jgi:hypothetical protein
MTRTTMKQEQRKSLRISEFMPVSVFITEAGGGVLAGPFPGRVVDICADGACLLMSQVESGRWHVYRSIREDEERRLRLDVAQQEQRLQLSVNARPVWLNTFERDEFHERVMGVMFIADEAAVGNRTIGPALC